MELVNSVMTWLMKKRIHQIELFIKYPYDVQAELRNHLIDTAKQTEFGKQHGFSGIRTYEQFKERIPVVTYEAFFPYVERLLRGEQNVTWPSHIKWFAKSSGTTNAQSKFIPVSQEALDNCHFKGGKDMMAIYINNNPNSKLFTGKYLAIGGSQQVNRLDKNANSFTGDVSAVLMKNLPFWMHFSRTPSMDVALMDNWEEKVEKIAQVTAHENVTSMAGVPTWTLVVLRRILALRNARDIREVWPHLEVFFHGAVSFTPYRALFADLIPSDDMHYLETYNATEGFFGIQDQQEAHEMLLMLDYGIFYEFIPTQDFDSPTPRTYDISEVEVGRQYAMVITTNAGLWRYKIGDTIKFTSVHPYRFIISGRTKHFINAFGEELIIENAEQGIASACQATQALVENFTAAPRFMGESGKQGCHEWIIEFARLPDSTETFVRALDETLRRINTDYDAKRTKDIAVTQPVVHPVAPGTFHRWMKRRGKLGGQNKVPRLANNREYVDDILAMISE